jgi:uncharacterized protein
MRVFFILMLLMSTVPMIEAREQHVKLLAVSESSGEPEGMIADLYLDVRPGSGHVFIDTFPLTKIDTQISTRFAKSMACSYLNVDCSTKDFFYTIRSSAAIVGGPSAGGALTLITIAALENDRIDERIAITGTINSGGLIGPVGSVAEKIDAAAEANLTKVLIPTGERFYTDETNTSNTTNKTIDLVEYGRERNVQIVEVSTIDDVVYEYMGKRRMRDYGNVSMQEDYARIMGAIAGDLCNRTTGLMLEVKDHRSVLYEAARNLSSSAQYSLAAGHYYSAASYCFGANIKATNEILREKNQSLKSLRDLIDEQLAIVSTMNQSLAHAPRETINDLQAYEVVKERLIEAADNLKKSGEAVRDKDEETAFYYYSYALERTKSATSWSKFFGAGGERLSIGSAQLKESCIEKLGEAEERYQYVQFYMPYRLQDTRIQLTRAYEDLSNGDYELCLFKATKTKAEADMILSAVGIADDQLDSYVATKLSLVRNEIARQQSVGKFPILGYSYYEYAETLRGSDPYSSLIYAEYALELSDLDIYFNTAKKRPLITFDIPLVGMFLLGTLFGLLLTLVFRRGGKADGKHINIKIKR